MHTRCPSCGAIYRIERPQLEVRAGLVRCGHCRRTFNASWNLLDRLPPEVDQGVAERASAPPAQTPGGEEPAVSLPAGSAGAEPGSGGAADRPAPHRDAQRDDRRPPAAEQANAGSSPELPASPLFEIPDIFRRRSPPSPEQATDGPSSSPPGETPPQEAPGDGRDPSPPAEDHPGTAGSSAGDEDAAEPPAGDRSTPGGAGTAERREPPRAGKSRDDSPQEEEAGGTPPGDDLAASTALPHSPETGYPDWVPDEEIVLQSAYEDWTEASHAGDRDGAEPGTQRRSTPPAGGDTSAGTDAPPARHAATQGTAIPGRTPGRRAVTFAGDDVSLVTLPRHRWSLTATWWIAAILLLGALGAQARYLYLDELAQLPRLRPLLGQACEVLECELPPRRAPQLVDLLETGVTVHPSVPGALRVTVTLANRASFPQPYPPLQVTLSDRGGEVVGRRTYSPSAYLQGSDMLMAPRSAQDVILDLANPAQSAIGYEVRLAAP